MSHLDYNNAVLIGLPQTSIKLLQRIQNIAAKLVLRYKRTDSATNALKELHWLPIILRIRFKIACLVHKCTFGVAPNYLKDLLTPLKPNLRLRSGQYHGLKYVVPFVKKKTFADRSFSVMGPRVWNDLPDDLRLTNNYDNFKCKLKTLLFAQF